MPLVSNGGRWLLVAGGTAHYEHLGEADLDTAPDEVERVVGALSRLGYQRCLHRLGLDPSSSELRTILPKWLQNLGQDDVVVIYYTSHGARDEERFYLLTRDSEEDNLDTTSVPAEDLARWVSKNTRIGQILVILDACYSGAGAAEFTAVVGKVTAAASAHSAVFVVAAARSKQEAEQGVLSSAIEAALTNTDGRLGGATQRFLALDDVMESVDVFLRTHRPSQTATWSSANVRGRARVFPNPLFRSQVQPGLDLESQRALLEHWVPKAMGAEVGSSGWYFVGRRAALEELVSWLSGDLSDTRARVVTGGAGCGKSALLARIVTLSEPSTRSAALAQGDAVPASVVPPESIVDVAVYARRKLVAELVRLLAEPLGIAALDSQELIGSLMKRPGKTVILIDALDEAEEPTETVSQLLRPLADLPNVLLLISTRPDSTGPGLRFRGMGESIVEIDLDDPRFFDLQDIERYVERRLLAVEEPNRSTPYRNQPKVARAVANGVAKRAGKVFLVARTAVHSLLAADSTVDTSAPGWVDSLPSGVEEAFEQFLAKFDSPAMESLSSATAKAVLMPLAFAQGEGLPWAGIWSPVATALSGHSISDEDIAGVLRHGAAFVIEALEAERSVYRLYHESLAEHLRTLTPANEMHRRIADVLSAIGGPDWFGAHPYIQTHLAEHASASGTLARLLGDPVFLLAASPDRLLPAVEASATTMSPGAAQDYRRTVHKLRERPLGEAASYLEMSLRQSGANQLADRIAAAPIRRPWSVPWAHWQRPGGERIIATGLGHVHALALARMQDGRQILISGSKDPNAGFYGVHFWDLTTGESLGSVSAGYRALAVTTVGERVIVGCGGVDGSVQMFDVATREPIGPPFYADAQDSRAAVLVLAACELSGRPILVSAHSNGTIVFWDPDTGTPYSEPLHMNFSSIYEVAFGVWQGRTVGVTGAPDGRISVWDLLSKKPMLQLGGGQGSVRAIALTRLHGRPVLISASSGFSIGKDPGIHLWPLDDHPDEPQVLEEVRADSSAIALAEVEGKPILLAKGPYNALQMWDLSTGKLFGRPLKGHDRPVESIAVGEIEGRPVAISGSEDGSIRVWELLGGVAAELTSNDMSFNELTVTRLAKRAVVVSGDSNGYIRFWDAQTGAPNNAPIPTYGSAVTALAVATIQRGKAILAGYADGGIRVWDARTHQLILELMPPDRKAQSRGVSALAVGEFNRTAVIVSTAWDGSLRLWNTADGQSLGEPFFGHEDIYPAIYAMTITTLGKRSIIVSAGDDGTIRFWELPTLRSVGEPIIKCQSLRAIAVGTIAGRKVVASGENWEVRIWDLEHRSEAIRRLQPHLGVYAVVMGVIAGEQVIVTGGHDQRLRVWSQDGGLRHEVDLDAVVTSLELVPPCRIACATTKGVLCLEFEEV